ncbi:MAG: purine-nucleoside phosphorylase [Saprospiraceae bacterium]|nr:purine-nucleoside phosphorylase [Saprospiraceae bacterium]
MLYEQIQEAVDYIRLYTDFTPQYGIILGTGLGNLTDDLLIACEIEYRDIPHFPVSTVQSHKGKLVFGYLEGQAVVVMAGRFHYYEGYSARQVTFPVRVLKALGIETLIITNVTGSTNADIEAGDIVLVRDHINLQPDNPLRGDNDERLGVRFPDMKNAYDKTMINKGLSIAKAHRIRIHTGVYVALQGPNLETPAEYNFINRIGGDLVGMSTVPEVLVARHSDLRTMVISIASNKCFPIEEIKETTVEDVIAVATQAEPKMRLIIKELLKN